MEIENSMYTLYCEHSLLSNVRGGLTDILCTAINEVTNGQAIGAQKIKAVWAICVRDNNARETLCNTGIAVDGVHIPLYLNNPHTDFVHDLRAKLLVACLVTPALWLNLSDSRNILIIHFGLKERTLDSIGHDLWKKI